MEGTSSDCDQLQLHQPKPQINTPVTSQENHTADFAVPHEKATQTHQTNQPTSPAKKSYTSD